MPHDINSYTPGKSPHWHRDYSDKLGELCLELLPDHALSGCDQVPIPYGIGKGKMWKAIKEGVA